MICLMVLYCKKNQEKTSLVSEKITESVYASGIVKTKNQYQVFSSVNGLIRKIFVTEGDTVKTGTALISIVNEMASLNTDNAKLAAEFAAMNANQDKLNELRLNIDLAKSKKENEGILLQRKRNLWTQNIG